MWSVTYAVRDTKRDKMTHAELSRAIRDSNWQLVYVYGRHSDLAGQIR